MTGVSRRKFLNGSAAVSMAGVAISKGALANPAENPIVLNGTSSPAVLARDETFWQTVASHYSVTRQVTNLENGFWGIMADPVLSEYQRLTSWINKENTLFARFRWGETYHSLHQSVAEFLGVSASEVALTRGATEALQSLIGGYNQLSAGDTVLYADLDYSEMKNAMQWLEDRRGVRAVKINFPEPAPDAQLTENDLLEFYRRSFDANPKTKLLLLTHLNNWTGLIIPVRKITEMAKERNIDVILDAAHSVGQVDFDISSLGCDYVGVNLHKWVGAPIGCGVIYIREGKTGNIDTYMGKNPGSGRTIDRIDTGTANFAAHMAIPAALEFHNQIGTKNKEARLRYLRDLWVSEVRNLQQVNVLTPDAPAMVAGLTSFRLDSITSTEGNNALMKRLVDEFGVLTTRRTGPAAGDCIRVTPSFYNTPEDMMKLVNALKAISRT